jgi:hypothetical protein
MVDSMESDLLDMLWDIVQAVDEERPSGVDGHRSMFAATWRFSNFTV